MSDTPDFMLPRPPVPTDPAVLAAFDQLYEASAAQGPADPIVYDLPAPRWQFICHVADTKDVVLHGSGNPEIAIFEPRQPNDSTVYGNQKAVYAASDGLWPMYFAILDRVTHPMLLINSSIRVEEPGRALSEPRYFFSITRSALDQRPYRKGTIYFLPRQTFSQQPPEKHGGRTIHIPQWASPEPVAPLCKIEVGPEDFPLLDNIRGHDDELAFARIRANPDGFPWLD